MFLNPADHPDIYRLIKNLQNKRKPWKWPLIAFPNQTILKGTHVTPMYSYRSVYFRGRLLRLKKSLITLHKKKSKFDPNNYRVIALMITLKKKMYNRVYKFCEKYNIFDESQFGFRNKRSTTLAVYYIQQVIILVFCLRTIYPHFSIVRTITT